MNKVLFPNVSCTLLAVLLLFLPASADDGQRPIPFALVESTPIVIDQPGRYIVTRNLTTLGSGPILSVAAFEVDIDLNRMELSPGPGLNAIEIAEGVRRAGELKTAKIAQIVESVSGDEWGQILA